MTLWLVGLLAVLVVALGWWVWRRPTAAPPTARPGAEARFVMELCDPAGRVEGRRTVKGPLPARFVRPHGRGRAAIYTVRERVTRQHWVYQRER